jgi:hypothetical protein
VVQQISVLKRHQGVSARSWSVWMVAAALAMAGCTAGTPRATGPDTTIGSGHDLATSPSGVTSPDRSGSPGAHDVVSIFDVDFIAPDYGFALVSDGCAEAAPRCTAVYATTDGSQWHRLPAGPFTVNGRCDTHDPCVQKILFATARIGYVYGSNVLYLTTDGGQHWTRQPGFQGADALTIAGNTVIRVSLSNVPHPVAARAPIGSLAWTPLSMPGGVPGVPIDGGVFLGRAGSFVVLAITDYAESKGDGVDQGARLYASSDKGHHWVRRGDPCPTAGTGFNDDTAALTVAPGRTIAVYCGVRSSTVTGVTLRASVLVSADGGRTYAPGPVRPHFGEVDRLVSATSHTLLVDVAAPHTLHDTVFRSTDTGKTWTPVAGWHPGSLGYLAFQSARVGHASETEFQGGSNVIWTTVNGGRTWTAERLRPR